MNNTAVGAKKVLFINKAHEQFYNKQLNKMRSKDVYHQALIYCLGLTDETRSNIKKIYKALYHFLLIKKVICYIYT